MNTPNKDYIASLPAKPVIAKLLIQVDGHFLIVKPTYKDGWTLVGGSVEDNESPLWAALREAQEEIDLRLTPSTVRLVLTHYSTAEHGRDMLYLIFGVTLEADQLGHITIAADEIAEYRLVEPSQLANFVTNKPVQALADMRAKGATSGFAEDGVYLMEGA